MKKNLLLWCCMTLLCVSCGKRITKTDLVGIVPKPVSEQLLDGTFDLNRHTKIRLLANDSMLMRSVDFFNGVVEPSLGKSLKAVQASVKQDKAINVWIEDSLEAEGYRLTIRPESIDIAGGSPAGVFTHSKPFANCCLPKHYKGNGPVLSNCLRSKSPISPILLIVGPCSMPAATFHG